MTRNSRFYQNHLNKVSRSFAFCIDQLEEPFKHQVGLAYLLFRVLDTIEDAVSEDVSEKKSYIQDFVHFFKKKPSSNKVQKWVETFLGTFSTGMNPDEKKLVQDSFILVLDFHTLDKRVQKVIRDQVANMARGMMCFLDQTKAGELRLRSLEEVNRYCFFVAGVVGELLSKLYTLCDSSFQKNRDSLLLSHHFGLFLQKINLLKDQKGDERQGRFLVPDRKAVWASTEMNAQLAFQYIEKIPHQSRGYRVFSAWSFFLGLGTLKWLIKSQKIPRLETFRLLKTVSDQIDKPDKLRKLFQELMRDVFQEKKQKNDCNTCNNLKSSTNIIWIKKFQGLYAGTITREHLVDLGMI